MIRPKLWRVFRWNRATTLGSFAEQRVEYERCYRSGSIQHHGVPAELCMWKGKPIDDCPNVRRTEINLHPELST
jgi:hypothetical protein